MRRSEARQGVRMMEFCDVLSRCEAAELSQWRRRSCWALASGRSGVGAGATRKRARRAWWIAGLAKRRASGFRWTGGEEVEALYRDALRRLHGQAFSRASGAATTGSAGATPGRRRSCMKGLLAKAKRRGAHRRKRPRRPLPGMMLHQDGSRHVWLGGGPPLDLMVTMDDATNEIYSAFLVEEEGTASTFRALLEVFGEHGLPLSLYTDRGSHYFQTPEAGGKVDRTRRPGRAGLAHLGVEHIAAYSPQARGRSERSFHTLAGSLVEGTGVGWDRHAWRRPTGGCAKFICRRTTRASRSRPEQEGSAFVAVPGFDLARCCAFRRSARWATTTACRSTADAADPGEPAARALRQGDGEGAPISRRRVGDVPRTAMPRTL